MYTDEAWLIDFGRFPYEDSWRLQKDLLRKRIEEEIPDTLILVEHDPVFTLGRKGSKDNLLVSPEFLKKKGVSLFHVERGGDITFHGPGQLVGYPIFHLKRGLAGVREFVRRLEETLIRTITRFGVPARRIDRLTGVWVGDEKIVSIGVAVKRWVTFHGFAFNVSTDLSYFDWIIPCGLRGKHMTSLSKILGRKVELDEVKPMLIESFKEVFSVKFKKVEPNLLWKAVTSPPG
jgi:lipoate-protein ligase B